MQYERHGLILEAEIEDENKEREMDVSLTKLFIWSIAKFFLSCVPPQTKVTMRGFHAQKETDKKYIFIVMADKVPNAQEYVNLVVAQEARGALDQSFVFSKLNSFVFDTTFSMKFILANLASKTSFSL